MTTETRFLIATAAEDRNATIAEIKRALKTRSGQAWSVTGGRGTAYGWIHIDVRPAIRSNYDTARVGRDKLSTLLGLPYKQAYGGVSVPASRAHYREYLERAHGLPVTAVAEPYWD
jgi:hypothetical protein